MLEGHLLGWAHCTMGTDRMMKQLLIPLLEILLWFLDICKYSGICIYQLIPILLYLGQGVIRVTMLAPLLLSQNTLFRVA